MRFIEKGLLSGKLTQRLITAGGAIIALAVMFSLLPLLHAQAAGGKTRRYKTDFCDFLPFLFSYLRVLPPACMHS